MMTQMWKKADIINEEITKSTKEEESGNLAMHSKAQQDSSVLNKSLTLQSWCILGHWQPMHLSVHKSFSKEHLPEFIDTSE